MLVPPPLPLPWPTTKASRPHSQLHHVDGSASPSLLLPCRSQPSLVISRWMALQFPTGPLHVLQTGGPTTRLLKPQRPPPNQRGSPVSALASLPCLHRRLLPQGLCTCHVCLKPSFLSHPCGLLTLSGLCLGVTFLREDTADRLARNSGASAPPPPPAPAASTASAAWRAPHGSSLHQAQPALGATRGQRAGGRTGVA